MNKIIPSRIASYNCEGCQHINLFGKITPQEILVILPTSSPLIKFATRPKKIPIGETQAIISNKKKVDKFLFTENK